VPPIVPILRRAPAPARSARAGEAGYNLVILIIVMTVMNILVAASLPAWTAVIRRDKEEELIFRGLQYAEAIRLFRNRTGGLPTRLEQLIEVKPRCLRQLWKDPMTEDGKWVLIFEGQPLPAGGGVPGNLNPDWEGGGTEIPPESLPGGPGAQDDVVAVGPIKGVRSRSKEDSFLKFDNRDRYDLWYFTVDLLNAGGSLPGPEGGFAVPRPGGGLVLSSRWIGRPWPRALAGLGLPGGAPQFGNPQPPGGFQPPGGAQPPGGRQPGGVRQPGGARPDNR